MFYMFAGDATAKANAVEDSAVTPPQGSASNKVDGAVSDIRDGVETISVKEEKDGGGAADAAAATTTPEEEDIFHEANEVRKGRAHHGLKLSGNGPINVARLAKFRHGRRQFREKPPRRRKESKVPSRLS